MAIDMALARELPEGEGILRIYRWARPTLSLGRNQPARNVYDESAPRFLGGEIVRRPTGGREVLHDRELTYAVILPLEALGGLRESYRILNEALVQALRSLGADVRLAPWSGPTPSPAAGDCFREAAEGEIEARGRKLVGSAQVRVGRTLLQHGSILLAPPSLSLDSFRVSPEGYEESRTDRSPSGASAGRELRRAPGITLAEVLPGGVGFRGVGAAVEAAMAGTLGGKWKEGRLREGESSSAEALLRKYRSSSWTWRR